MGSRVISSMQPHPSPLGCSDASDAFDASDASRTSTGALKLHFSTVAYRGLELAEPTDLHPAMGFQGGWEMAEDGHEAFPYCKGLWAQSGFYYPAPLY